METVHESVDVAAPLEAVYDAWTRYEDFPEFMEGVEEVRQSDETHVRWRMRIDGVERELDAEIVEQRPCERIAWQATAGDAHRGSVTFEPLDHGCTRVTLRVENDSARRFDHARADSLRLRGDLDRFKAMLEAARRA
jgi:uncharacterized membrane protein